MVRLTPIVSIMSVRGVNKARHDVSRSPRFSKLIKLLLLTWFPNLVNLLPSEQLEISSTDMLGLQKAAEEDGVLWQSSGGTSTDPLPLCPLPARRSQHRGAALWGRGQGKQGIGCALPWDFGVLALVS